MQLTINNTPSTTQELQIIAAALLHYHSRHVNLATAKRYQNKTVVSYAAAQQREKKQQHHKETAAEIYQLIEKINA